MLLANGVDLRETFNEWDMAAERVGGFQFVPEGQYEQQGP